MANVFGDLAALLQHNPGLAIAAVFLGGVTTALNPCVLAMVPLLMGIVAGNDETSTARRSLVFSLFFVLGLAVTFTILGLISAIMGKLFGNVGPFWKYAVAGICLVMGLHLLGVLKLKLPSPRESGSGPGASSGPSCSASSSASSRRRAPSPSWPCCWHLSPRRGA